MLPTGIGRCGPHGLDGSMSRQRVRGDVWGAAQVRPRGGRRPHGAATHRAGRAIPVDTGDPDSSGPPTPPFVRRTPALQAGCMNALALGTRAMPHRHHLRPFGLGRTSGKPGDSRGAAVVPVFFGCPARARQRDRSVQPVPARSGMPRAAGMAKAALRGSWSPGARPVAMVRHRSQGRRWRTGSRGRNWSSTTTRTRTRRRAPWRRDPRHRPDQPGTSGG